MSDQGKLENEQASVQRYSAYVGNAHYCEGPDAKAAYHEEDNEGDWVNYDDYARVEAERDFLRTQLATANEDAQFYADRCKEIRTQLEQAQRELKIAREANEICHKAVCPKYDLDQRAALIASTFKAAQADLIARGEIEPQENNK